MPCTITPTADTASPLPAQPRRSASASGFMRQQQVLQLVPISKSTLWRRVQARTFPAPFKLSDRVTVWRVDEIQRWIDRQCGQEVQPE